MEDQVFITNLILTMTTLMALFGAILVSYGQWEGFAIWCCTNTFFAIHNYYIDQMQMCALFSCYLFLAVLGMRNSLKEVK